MIHRKPQRALIAATLLFAVALFTFGSALWGALRTETQAPAEQDTSREIPPATGLAARPQVAQGSQEPSLAPADGVADPVAETGSVLSNAAMRMAVDGNPFSPDRVRPAQRYRLPGDVEPPPAPAPSRPPRPALQLVGTSVTDDGASALIRTEDGAARLLSVGESIGGYVLAAVNHRGAVLSNGEDNMELRVPAPQQNVAVNDPRAGRNNARTPQQTAAQRATAQRMLDQMRTNGASPQALEQAARMLQQGNAAVTVYETGEGGFRFESQDGRTVISGRASTSGGQNRTIRVDSMVRMVPPPQSPIRR